MDIFDESLTYLESISVIAPIQSSVLEAVKLFKAILSSPKVLFELFKPTALKINENLSDETLTKIIADVVAKGFDVILDRLNHSIMQVVAVPNVRDPELRRPQL